MKTSAAKVGRQREQIVGMGRWLSSSMSMRNWFASRSKSISQRQGRRVTNSKWCLSELEGNPDTTNIKKKVQYRKLIIYQRPSQSVQTIISGIQMHLHCTKQDAFRNQNQPKRELGSNSLASVFISCPKNCTLKASQVRGYLAKMQHQDQDFAINFLTNFLY